MSNNSKIIWVPSSPDSDDSSSSKATSSSAGGSATQNNSSPSTGGTTSNQGAGGSFETGVPGLAGYAAPGVTAIYEGSKKTGATLLYGGGSYHHLPGESGTLPSGEPVRSQTQSSYQDVASTRQMMIDEENLSRLDDAGKRDYYKQQAAEERQRRINKKKEEENNNLRFGPIIRQDVQLSPALAKKYASEVLRQSLPINEKENTTVSVYTDLGSTPNYRIEYPQSQDKEAEKLYNITPKKEGETAQERFNKIYEDSEYIKKGNKLLGNAVTTGTQIFESAYYQFKQLFSQDYQKESQQYFDFLGHPVVNEYGEPVAGAKRYLQAEQNNIFLLSMAGATMTTIKPQQIDNKILKKFEGDQKVVIKNEPEGQGFKGSNEFSDQQVRIDDLKTVTNKDNVLTQKTSSRFSTFEKKLTVISPEDANANLRTSGIATNEGQVTYTLKKGIFKDYEQLSYTNPEGLTTQEFFSVNKITGARKYLGMIKIENTPSIQFTEPRLSTIAKNSKTGYNYIIETEQSAEYQQGIQSGNLERHSIRGTLETIKTTGTTTRATGGGTRQSYYLNNAGELEPISFEQDLAKYAYSPEATAQQQTINIRTGARSGSLKISQENPFVSETTQISTAEQTGLISIEKQSLFKKLANMRISFTNEEPSSSLISIKVVNPESNNLVLFGKKPESIVSTIRQEPYIKVLNEQKTIAPLSQFSRESYFKRGYPLSDNNLEIINEPQIRLIDINKPNPENVFGFTKIYLPESPMIQNPEIIPIIKPAVNERINSESNILNSLKPSESSNVIFSSKIRDIQKINIGPKESTESERMFKPVPGINNININKPISSTEQNQQQEPIIIPQQKPTQKQIFSPPLSPFKFQGPKTPEIKIPKFPVPSLESKSVSGFDVFVRQKGMFKKVKSGLFKEEALAYGAGLIESTAAATFKISQGTSQAKPLKGGVLGSLKNFYRKGESYIEKRSSRINTAGELQEITFKGLSSPKKKKGKRSKNIFGGMGL